MVQLVCMDMESVLRVVEIVSACLGRVVKEAVGQGVEGRVTVLGAWCWGLLGRVRACGEMGSGEVAGVRELGKRAVEALKCLGRDVDVDVGDREGDIDLDDGDAGDESDWDETWEGFVDDVEVEGQEMAERDGHDGPDTTTTEEIGGDVAALAQDHPDIALNSHDHANERPSPTPENTNDLDPSSSHPTLSPPSLKNPNSPPTNLSLSLEAAKTALRSQLPTQLHSAPSTLTPTPQPLRTPGEASASVSSPSSSSSEYDPETAVPAPTQKQNLDLHSRIKAMLDIIITIVGEEYGQRDLLGGGREVWVGLAE